MAQSIRFYLNGQDRGQPLRPDDFGFTVSENDELNARIVSFNNDLTFDGAAARYLIGIIEAGACSLVKVRVTYLCGKKWQFLVDCYIVISDCIRNYDKCQVSVKLNDESFSTRINNNRAIPFSTKSTKTKNLLTVVPPFSTLVLFFNPPTGIYDTAQDGVSCISVYQAFAHIISCISDNNVDFDSNYLRITPSLTVEKTGLFMTGGRAIFSRSGDEVIYDFQKLFTAINKKKKLCIVFEKQANGRPLLRIELDEYRFQLGADVNCFDQRGIEMSFDSQALYAAVNFGSDPVLEQNECNSGNSSCTFAQTPFRGFRNETFGILGECNTSSKLDLVSSDVIFDTNVIEDIFRFGSQAYMDNPVIVEVTYQAALYKALQGDPYGIGQTVYNPGFTNEAVSQNWLSGFPNSIYSYLVGFSPTDTNFEYRTTLPLQNWEVIFDTYTSFVEATGFFIKFADPITPRPSAFDLRTYFVPFPGIYQFSGQVILDRFAATAGTRSAFISIEHYDANDTLISISNGVVIIDLNINTVIVAHTASFVCNAGDMIRVNVSVKLNTAGPNLVQAIKDTITIDGIAYFSYFLGFGTPFQSSELQPVDPSLYKRFLYKFDRPLKMQEIKFILNNTSKPITFGRVDDPLRVIAGYIKNVSVGSVVKQGATFELKSNKILK